MRFSIFDFRFSICKSIGAPSALKSKITNRKSKIAFTLLELLVVLIVIGVLAAMMAPGFVGQRATAELRATAVSLRAAARHGHDRATLRNRTCRLFIGQDDDRAGFRLEVESDASPGSWMPMPQSLVGTVTLPKGVRFTAVRIDPVQRDPTAEQAIYFYADGSADPALVQLTNGKATWTLLVEPNTGRTDLADHAIAVNPDRREDLDA